jgi:hypothetical protein
MSPSVRIASAVDTERVARDIRRDRSKLSSRARLKASRERLERRSLEPDLRPGHWTKVFEDWTGKGEGDFPEDFSLNHNHYIHGASKKW